MTEDIATRHWDAIVVGTGMGGATIGYSLAKAGKSVLFCEKGKSSRSSVSIKGCYAEERMGIARSSDANQRAVLENAGREWM